MAVLASCGSNDMTPEEMVTKGVNEYNNANYYDAFELFKKAAELGYAKAQNNLGVLYKQGVGVEKNLSYAAYWFAKAAEQGDEDAIENLKHIQDAPANQVPASCDDEPKPEPETMVEAEVPAPEAAPEPVQVAQPQPVEGTQTQKRATANSQKSQSNNFVRKQYFMTGYCTNGQGGWVTAGQSEPAKDFSLSDNKILGLDGSFTYTGQATLFNIPLRVYVNDNNSEMFILRYGNELMVAMTTYGLFLSELQQVGVANRWLSRNYINGWYNAGGTILPSNNSSSSQSAPRQQKTARTCTLCNGTGKYLIEYSSQYGNPGSEAPKYWCDICKKYDYSHYHKTCPSCGGKGVVQ
ncbi:MAG: hypothetical protein ACI4UL_08895 [Muribaculaceae bacterium]